ncbi:MAG: Gfo/Idh/MocA family protein [Methyloceanibacter sp.]
MASGVDDSIAVGVIGAGFIAQVAHLPALASTVSCRIVGLADNRPELLDEVAKRYAIPRSFTDYRELLASDGVDAVVVVMPRRAQSAVTRDVLDAGLPVLTEKPMAYTASVADKLVALAKSKGVTLAVGYPRAYDRGARLFQTLLEREKAEGELGDLLHVRVADFCGAYTVPMPPHTRGTKPRPFRYPEDPVAPPFLEPDLHQAYDYTINVMSHDLNLVRSLFGDLLEPIAFRVRPGGVQHAVLAATAVDVELSVGPASLGVWDQRIDVYFRKGCLSLVLDTSLARQSCGVVVRRHSGGEEERLMPPISERQFAFDLQAEGFIDSIRRGVPFAPDGKMAAKDIATIEDLWRIASVAS